MIRPRVGMVLAAGRGERLRPISDTIPKPLVTIGGRTLLDHAIDRLEAVGVETVVVNVHHLADRIVEHLKTRSSPRIVISHEAGQALETGGAIVHARALLGAAPFYVVNGDSLWLDGRTSALARLAAAWEAAPVDVVLLVQRTVTALGYDDHRGDCALDPLGRLRWRGEREVTPYLYAGVQLISPTLFRDRAPGTFRVNAVWETARAADRLRAIVHDGEWYHVSTPEGLALVRERLERQRVER
jgi:MurNAc alpha-1-phosphate uridylyltransferase